MWALGAEPQATAPASPGEPRPFYLIKHCTNSVRRLRNVHDEGANAVELDIQWHHGEVHIGHPLPTPPACWFHHANGEDVHTYFRELGEHLRGEGEPIELVILDIKRPDVDTRSYADALAKELVTAGIPPQRVVMSIPYQSAFEFVNDIRNSGFEVGHVDAWHDVSGGELPNDWLDASCSAGACFLGVGADPIVFWRPATSWRKAIQQMTRRRDGAGPLHHVYFWTLERRASFRFALDLGVDGVIVNRPRHFLPVLEEYRNSYVLATNPEPEGLY
jgi:hypothetical protein